MRILSVSGAVRSPFWAHAVPGAWVAYTAPEFGLRLTRYNRGFVLAVGWLRISWFGIR